MVSFTCFSLFLGPHPSVSSCVFVCALLCLLFCITIHLMSCVWIRFCVSFPSFISQSECVCVCAHSLCTIIHPVLIRWILFCRLGTFACVSLFLVSYPSASVFECVQSFALNLQHYLSDIIKLRLLVFFFYWCHIPVRVLFVCEWLCPSFAPLFIWSCLGTFACLSLFLGSHPSASIEC